MLIPCRNEQSLFLFFLKYRIKIDHGMVVQHFFFLYLLLVDNIHTSLYIRYQEEC